MLNRSSYFIKEQVGLVKLTDRYDIFAPEDGRQLGFAQEKVSMIMHLGRFLFNKNLLPTTIEVKETEAAAPLFSIKRSFTLFRSRVNIHDSQDTVVGYMKSKVFSLGGGFDVFDCKDNRVAEVKGDWKGWNFKLLSQEGKEIGTITKKWAGIGKELFTTADNYMIAINDEIKPTPATAMLLLAAGLAVDCIYKEK